MRLFLRLTTEVNDRLRTMMRYHRELPRCIDEALSAADLEAVELLSAESGRARGHNGGHFPLGERPPPLRGEATRLHGHDTRKQRAQRMARRDACRVGGI